MEIDKPTIKIISFTFLISFLWIISSFAESLQCPQTDYSLKKTSLLSPGWFNCRYQKDIEIDARWKVSPSKNDCKTVLNPQDRLGVENFVRIWENGKTVTLYSETFPASVSIKLNRNEFKEKRRPYWMSIARDFLKKVEQKAINCKGLKFNTEQPKIVSQPSKKTNQSEKIKQADLPKKNMVAPSSMDSWDAPSPKAKIPE